MDSILIVMLIMELLYISITIVSSTYIGKMESIGNKRKDNVVHSTSRGVEDLYGAIHRKEYEMKQLSKQHKGTADPVRMAMGYIEEKEPKLKLARALRRA